MSGFYDEIFSEVKSLVLATWPGVSPDSCFSSVQALKLNLQAQGMGSQNSIAGSLSPPFAVIDIGEIQPDRDQMTGLYFRVPLSFYYLDEIRTDPTMDMQASIMAQLELMRAAMETTANLGSVQWDGVPGRKDTGPRESLAGLNTQFQSGVLEYQPGFITVMS